MFASSEEATLTETTHSTQITSSSSVDTEDLERVTQERNEALKELKKVKDEMVESEKSRKQLTDELQKVKQEAKSAVEECRALRNRIQLAEAAHRQAQGMEMDYEEVVQLLEAEITELKAQLADQQGQTKARHRVTPCYCSNTMVIGPCSGYVCFYPSLQSRSEPVSV
ncbi:syntaxin-binding protein 4-like [Chiloscyllium plagiosum]|uniref:syntaxin-binding protein 4-like n=1 Tax=Chiloscyllium plagiosum TaxID=36176 RepID=UPI001CB83B53|nr:syntaxin-binding protein 4-like [Chiloscyllium plagiosum]